MACCLTSMGRSVVRGGCVESGRTQQLAKRRTHGKAREEHERCDPRDTEPGTHRVSISVFLHRKPLSATRPSNAIGAVLAGSSETRLPQISARLRRSELAITDTELKLIAAAAIIGLSSRPNTGYSTPAAIGTPLAL